MLHMMASESLARISGNGYNVKFFRGNFDLSIPITFRIKSETTSTKKTFSKMAS